MPVASRLHPAFARIIAACAMLALAPTARAQDCDCDHTIGVDQETANGAELGVAPGDRVCVLAGDRQRLVLEGFVGTAGAPVVILNCGGQVRIANVDRGYGLLINGSSFFRLTGTGDPATPYGFDVSASRTGPDYAGSGVPVGDLSTDYELDHLEVHHTGFAGFVLKTESRCDGTANLGQFVQRNTRVHDCFVHDTGGEAFYVGSTGYGGRDFDCDGATVTLYPHEHEGVFLHDNLIRDTGWDGLQVGVTPRDCEIYRNVIVGVGRTATDPVQTRGIQIGGASACVVRDNVLADGPTIGIFVLGAGDTLVQNNVVVDFAEEGIYGNDQGNGAIAGASYRFVHNTLVRTGTDRALALFGALTSANAIVNNLLVQTVADPVGVGNDVDALEEGTLALATVAEARFVDPTARDFHLMAESPARDVGVLVAGNAATHDLDGVERDSSPDVGAYEYTDAVRPDAGTPIGPGSGPVLEAAPMGDGGCGCRASGAPSQQEGTGVALLHLLALALLRARASSDRS